MTHRDRLEALRQVALAGAANVERHIVKPHRAVQSSSTARRKRHRMVNRYCVIPAETLNRRPSANAFLPSSYAMSSHSSSESKCSSTYRMA